MKSITYLGKRIWREGASRDGDGRFSSVWARVRKVIRVSAYTMAAALMLTGVYVFGTMQTTIEYHATVVSPSAIAPILEKIAMAESGGKQFDANGLPIFHANTNGSVDIGKYQINNRVWGAKAKELGYDLLTDKGQDEMATWILENKGTSAWGSSAASWNK